MQLQAKETMPAGRRIVYFDASGPANTGQVLDIVRERLAELGMKKVVVASTTGGTAARAAEALPGIKVIAVSHRTGHKKVNLQEFTEDNRKAVESRGGVVHTGVDAFSGTGRALRKKFNSYSENDIISNTLRIVGTGIKVAVEVAIMAADAGLVDSGERVIVVAGNEKGADTAALVTCRNCEELFDVRVHEILCKPY